MTDMVAADLALCVVVKKEQHLGKPAPSPCRPRSVTVGRVPVPEAGRQCRSGVSDRDT